MELAAILKSAPCWQRRRCVAPCTVAVLPELEEGYAALEQELLEKINALDIGPQGFGGQTTALGVNIETYATHIAGLPVAVNVGCHVTRHATKEL